MTDSRRFLMMRAGEHSYAIPFEQVAEVTELKVLSPVPRAPVWCTGAVRSGGIVAAVVDLALYAGDESEHCKEKIVVLDLHLGGLALLVGDVQSVILEGPVRLEKDGYCSWILTPELKAELLDASELVQEISAAMLR